MITHTLTGRTRYRTEKRWFREPLLVLQVEVHAEGWYVDYTFSTPTVDDKFWRDATTQDISTYVKEPPR